jgi:hypothetical protein
MTFCVVYYLIGQEKDYGGALDHPPHDLIIKKVNLG